MHSVKGRIYKSVLANTGIAALVYFFFLLMWLIGFSPFLLIGCYVAQASPEHVVYLRMTLNS